MSVAVSNIPNPGVNDKNEGCRLKCDNNVECMFYFVQTAVDANWCVLFKSCDELVPNSNPGIVFAKHVTGNRYALSWDYGL